MIRFVAALFVTAVLANAAIADLPPPLGEKYVLVNNEVVLGKDVTGYVFVMRSSSMFGSSTHSKLELPAGQAVAIYADRKHGATLYAVPEAVAKEFNTDRELYDALEKAKAPGTQSIGFGGRTTVSRLVIGNSVKWTTTITGIDANGIKTKVEGMGSEPPMPERNDKPHARGMPCATIGAATLTVIFGGLWLVRRTRRKP